MKPSDLGPERVMRQYLAHALEGGCTRSAGCLDRFLVKGMNNFPPPSSLEAKASRCSLFEQLLNGGRRKQERLLVPDLATNWFRKQKIYLDKLSIEELSDISKGLVTPDVSHDVEDCCTCLEETKCPEQLRRMLCHQYRHGISSNCGCPETTQDPGQKPGGKVAECLPTTAPRSRNPFLLSCEEAAATTTMERRSQTLLRPRNLLCDPTGASGVKVLRRSCSCLKCPCRTMQADDYGPCLAAQRMEPVVPCLRRNYDLRQVPQRQLDPTAFRRISPEFFRILDAYETAMSEMCPLYGISMRHWGETCDCCPCEKEHFLGDQAVTTPAVSPCRQPRLNRSPADRAKLKKANQELKKGEAKRREKRGISTANEEKQRQLGHTDTQKQRGDQGQSQTSSNYTSASYFSGVPEQEEQDRQGQGQSKQTIQSTTSTEEQQKQQLEQQKQQLEQQKEQLEQQKQQLQQLKQHQLRQEQQQQQQQEQAKTKKQPPKPPRKRRDWRTCFKQVPTTPMAGCFPSMSPACPCPPLSSAPTPPSSLSVEPKRTLFGGLSGLCKRHLLYNLGSNFHHNREKYAQLQKAKQKRMQKRELERDRERQQSRVSQPLEQKIFVKQPAPCSWQKAKKPGAMEMQAGDSCTTLMPQVCASYAQCGMQQERTEQQDQEQVKQLEENMTQENLVCNKQSLRFRSPASERSFAGWADLSESTEASSQQTRIYQPESAKRVPSLQGGAEKPAPKPAPVRRKRSTETDYTRCGYRPRACYLANDFHQLMLRVARPRPSPPKASSKIRQKPKEAKEAKEPTEIKAQAKPKPKPKPKPKAKPKEPSPAPACPISSPQPRCRQIQRIKKKCQVKASPVTTDTHCSCRSLSISKGQSDIPSEKYQSPTASQAFSEDTSARFRSCHCTGQEEVIARPTSCVSVMFSQKSSSPSGSLPGATTSSKKPRKQSPSSIISRRPSPRQQRSDTPSGGIPSRSPSPRHQRKAKSSAKIPSRSPSPRQSRYPTCGGIVTISALPRQRGHTPIGRIHTRTRQRSHTPSGRGATRTRQQSQTPSGTTPARGHSSQRWRVQRKPCSIQAATKSPGTTKKRRGKRSTSCGSSSSGRKVKRDRSARCQRCKQASEASDCRLWGQNSTSKVCRGRSTEYSTQFYSPCSSTNRVRSKDTVSQNNTDAQYIIRCKTASWSEQQRRSRRHCSSHGSDNGRSAASFHLNLSSCSQRQRSSNVSADHEKSSYSRQDACLRNQVNEPSSRSTLKKRCSSVQWQTPVMSSKESTVPPVERLETGRRYYTETQPDRASRARCSCRSFHSSCSIRALSSNTDSMRCPCAPAPSVASVEPPLNNVEQEQEQDQYYDYQEPQTEQESIMPQSSCVQSSFSQPPPDCVCNTSCQCCRPKPGYFKDTLRWEERQHRHARTRLRTHRPPPPPPQPSPPPEPEPEPAPSPPPTLQQDVYYGNVGVEQQAAAWQEAPEYYNECNCLQDTYNECNCLQNTYNECNCLQDSNQQWGNGTYYQPEQAIRQEEMPRNQPTTQPYGYYQQGQQQFHCPYEQRRDQTGAIAAAAQGLRGLVNALGGPRHRPQQDLEGRRTNNGNGSPMGYNQGAYYPQTTMQSGYNREQAMETEPGIDLSYRTERNADMSSGMDSFTTNCDSSCYTQESRESTRRWARSEAEVARLKGGIKAERLARERERRTASGAVASFDSVLDFRPGPSTSRRSRSAQKKKKRQTGGASPENRKQPTPLAIFLDNLRAKHDASQSQSTLVYLTTTTETESLEFRENNHDADVDDNLQTRHHSPSSVEATLVIPATYTALLEEQVIDEYPAKPRYKRRIPNHRQATTQ